MTKTLRYALLALDDSEWVLKELHRRADSAKGSYDYHRKKESGSWILFDRATGEVTSEKKTKAPCPPDLVHDAVTKARLNDAEG